MSPSALCWELSAWWMPSRAGLGEIPVSVTLSLVLGAVSLVDTKQSWAWGDPCQCHPQPCAGSCQPGGCQAELGLGRSLSVSPSALCWELSAWWMPGRAGFGEIPVSVTLSLVLGAVSLVDAKQSWAWGDPCQCHPQPCAGSSVICCASRR